MRRDGYFQQPTREAASALRHRWLAAMALVAVHALLVVSLLLVHAAVKATSVPAASSAGGLGQELLDMPQRIESVLEAAVDDAVDDEPGLIAEQRQARDRDKPAAGPSSFPAEDATGDTKGVEVGAGDLREEQAADDATEPILDPDVGAVKGSATVKEYATTAVDAAAVCNDGSPGAFYHRPGVGDGADKWVIRWVIRFLGGAWCWDAASCAARWLSTPYLMSTLKLPQVTSASAHVDGVPDVVLQSHGILSEDPAANPYFHSWNHVSVWYCSSDSHLGDAPAEGEGLAAIRPAAAPARVSQARGCLAAHDAAHNASRAGDGRLRVQGAGEAGGWQFRGKRIAAAVARRLLGELGLDAGSQVLLTGDSAGGVGCLHNADWLYDMLQPRMPRLTSFKVFIDAGWFLDVPPYTSLRSDGFSFQKCAKGLLHNWHAQFDRTCVEAYGLESWRCFFAQYAHAHVATPALFHEFLYDSANLGCTNGMKPMGPILVAVTDSEASVRAVEYAVEFLAQPGDELLLVHVLYEAKLLCLVARAAPMPVIVAPPRPGAAGTDGRGESALAPQPRKRTFLEAISPHAAAGGGAEARRRADGAGALRGHVDSGVLQFAMNPLAGGTLPHCDRLPPLAPAPPISKPWDGRPLGSPDIPLSELAKTVGALEPEQIHLALGGNDAVFVSWTTGNASIVGDSAEVAGLLNQTRPVSTVEYGLDPDTLDKTVNGSSKAYAQSYPGATYVSGAMHHAKLEGLQPLTTYFYRCGDGAHNAWSRVLNFTTLQAVGPDAFPQRFGLVGDLGQTQNSSVTLRHLTAANPPIVILVGDYSYADNYQPNGQRRRYDQPPSSYHPRWDSWGRFVEPLVSRVPMMAVSGNHEVEPDADGKTFQAYETRYRYPHAESGSESQQEYSFDAAGVHWVMLGWTKTKEHNLDWLRADLAAVERARTPWLIAVIHPPWYNTYNAHFKEVECMRLALEPTFYEFGVDLVFTGHVHAYERHNRVYDYQLNDCAPYYVTIGDGGNIEQLYVEWVNRTNCPPETVTQCPTHQNGHFCPSEQPSWSAYREPSFGMGVLEVKSATEAEWTWHRNQDGAAVVRDRVTFTRGDPACAGRRAPPPALPPALA
ncbi:hypothetical protein WJX81_004396 [Elliptochloris bilobata]|uniref:Purple acid phosphatase n=1 Tax=Elliptochloris bilobata TaxID=381761 RepID=A0AAW1S0X8_9CHLO